MRRPPAVAMLAGVPCKTSIMWSFDAAKGDFLYAKSTAVQNLVVGHRRQGRGQAE